MTVPVRLAAFGALLAAAFGLAALVGGAADPDARSQRAAEEKPHAGSGGHAEEPAAGHAAGGHSSAGSAEVAAPVRGLAVADGGFALEIDRGDFEAGKPGTLAFHITRDGGGTLRSFQVEHEKRLHLIIVRRDGTGFQHLHPAMDRDGTWRQRLTLRDPGSYRVFADFKSGDEAQTLATDLNVSGAAAYEALPAPATSFTTPRGYDVVLERDGDVLRFAVTKDGRTVHTEPYLGAGGHLVALREGDLAYLHTHPADHGGGDGAHDDRVAFETTFPSAGRYRLYFQFKHEGRVHTAEFTQEVPR